MSSLPSRLRSKLGFLRKKKDSASGEDPLTANRSEMPETKIQAPAPMSPGTIVMQGQQLKTDIKAARKALENFENIAEDYLAKDDTTITSTALLINDLRRNTHTLNRIISGHLSPAPVKVGVTDGIKNLCTPSSWSFEKQVEEELDSTIEHPRALSRLPTPDFSNSFDYREDGDYLSDSGSDYSQDVSVAPPHEGSVPFSSSPLTSPFHVAPLNLPNRTPSIQSSTAGSVRKTRSPVPHRSPFLTLRHNHSRSSPTQIYEIRQSRPLPPVPSRTRPTSEIHPFTNDEYGYSPESSSNRYLSLQPSISMLHRVESNSSHFSTAEKTRRLRNLRGTTTPDESGFGDDVSRMRLSVEQEPLRVDELMTYLREGGSIRDL